MHLPSPKLGTRALVLVGVLFLTVVPAAFASDHGPADTAGEVVTAPVDGTPWSGWLDLWRPIESWIADQVLALTGNGPCPAEGTTGTTGGTGDPAGIGGPGSGGGVVDPNG